MILRLYIGDTYLQQPERILCDLASIDLCDLYLPTRVLSIHYDLMLIDICDSFAFNLLYVMYTPSDQRFHLVLILQYISR